MLRSNRDEARDTGSSYENELNKCQNGSEELMRTESACLGCEGKWMTERTSDVHFQRKVSHRYHGSHCDLEMNFNAPLWRFCVTIPLPLSFLFFLGGGWGGEHPLLSPLPILLRWHPNRHMCMWCARTQKACAHGKERWGGKSLHKRFITNVSNPLLHCQGDVIKHTL